MEKEFVPYELAVKLKDLEEWKDVKGYEGLYQVSNMGNVRSLNYKGIKGLTQNLKPALSNKGYFMLPLCKKGKQKTHCVHRLVAESFLEIPEELKNKRITVNHKNGVKTNNTIKNLEWCSYSDNNKHAYKFLGKKSGMKSRTGRSNVNSKSVRLFTDDLIIDKTFESMTEASK